MTGSTGTVRIEGNRVVLEDFRLEDAGIARFLEERTEAERVPLAGRGLRIGLEALMGMQTRMDVDLVRREFEGLLREWKDQQEEAKRQIQQELERAFGPDGKMPAEFRQYLGQNGRLTAEIASLFDPNRGDSAHSRLRNLLDETLSPSSGLLRNLLDPEHPESPLFKARKSLSERLDQISQQIATNDGRKSERVKGTGQGRDFETNVVEMLRSLLRGSDDEVIASGDSTGEGRAKKGDAIIQIDARRSSGDPSPGERGRIVVEVKTRGNMSGPEIAKELRASRENRHADMAIIVFDRTKAPSSIDREPIGWHQDGILCSLDPEQMEEQVLEWALRLARLRMRVERSRATGKAVADAEFMRGFLTRLNERLKSITVVKSSLTALRKGVEELGAKLDDLGKAVQGDIAELEGLVGAPEELPAPAEST